MKNNFSHKNKALIKQGGFVKKLFILLVVFIAIALLISVSYSPGELEPLPELPLAKDTLTISPAEGMVSDDIYVPGTESLAADEMRIIALGTGMPSSRPKQAAACFLVELGNNEKFLFDIGSDCYSRINTQEIPMNDLDKVFPTHLHVDHYGDLAALWLGGSAERTVPLRVWGPSGPEPELGTAHALKLMQEMYAWEIESRKGTPSEAGLKLEVNEFKYGHVNRIIYEENGVVIHSFPAAHGLDGSVSYTLTWKDLTFAFVGDTIPNQYWVEHTKGVDISIHESFLPSILLMEKQGFNVLESLTVGTQGHTSPEQFGRVMQMTKPRLALGYHFYNDADIAPEMRRRIRKTYNGDLALLQDFMAINVTKDNIRVRMVEGAFKN